MPRHIAHSTKPKTKARAERFRKWLASAASADLDKAYASALKQGNKFQKHEINEELRRRELVSEGVA